MYHLPPVNCGVPHVPGNGIIENMLSISTVGGAQIFFRCNPRYVPAGRMSATCLSPDGISVVGNWIPDPADLVCNGEIQEAESPLYMARLISHNEVVSCIAPRLVNSSPQWW